jgi:hypothetical protein
LTAGPSVDGGLLELVEYCSNRSSNWRMRCPRAAIRCWYCRRTAAKAACAAGRTWSHSAGGIGGSNDMELFYKQQDVYTSSIQARIR